MVQPFRLTLLLQFDSDFSNMGGYKGTLYPLEGGIQPGEVSGQHLVAMTENISAGQRCGGSWHGQG